MAQNRYHARGSRQRKQRRVWENRGGPRRGVGRTGEGLRRTPSERPEGTPRMSIMPPPQPRPEPSQGRYTASVPDLRVQLALSILSHRKWPAECAWDIQQVQQALMGDDIEAML